MCGIVLGVVGRRLAFEAPAVFLLGFLSQIEHEPSPGTIAGYELMVVFFGRQHSKHCFRNMMELLP